MKVIACNMVSPSVSCQECPTEPILKIAAPQAKLCWLANLRMRQNPGWDGISSRKFAGNFVKYRSVAGKILLSFGWPAEKTNNNSD